MGATGAVCHEAFSAVKGMKKPTEWATLGSLTSKSAPLSPSVDINPSRVNAPVREQREKKKFPKFVLSLDLVQRIVFLRVPKIQASGRNKCVGESRTLAFTPEEEGSQIEKGEESGGMPVTLGL